MKSLPTIDGVLIKGVVIEFKELGNGLPYLGAVTLEKDGRNVVLDTTQCYTDEKRNYISIDFEYDYEVFPNGDNWNYLLTKEDLLSGELDVAEFFIDDYDKDPTKIYLMVETGTETVDIPLSF